MANLKNFGRQYVLGGEQTISFDDLINGSISTTMKAALPPGAILMSGGLIIETAWNSATSAVVDIGDATTNTKFATGLNLKSAAGTFLPLTGIGIKQTAGDDITFKLTEVGATATAGTARFVYTYLVQNRVNEVME
jgi:hypothetical protein